MASIEKTTTSVSLTINQKAYPAGTIIEAACSFLDKAYIHLDRGAEGEYLVTITPKNETDPIILGREFGNELIKWSEYHYRARATASLRHMVLQRSFFTNDPSSFIDIPFDDQAFERFKQQMMQGEPTHVSLERKPTTR